MLRSSESLFDIIFVALIMLLVLMSWTRESRADGILEITVWNNDVRIESLDNGDKDIRVSMFRVDGQHHVHVIHSGSTFVSVAGDYYETYSNGANIASVVIDGHIDDLRIWMGDGDDSVVVSDYEELGSNGDIVIDTGHGNDFVEVKDSDCRYLVAYGGRHNDEIEINECISRFLRIESFRGDDKIQLDGAYSENGAFVNTHDGSDDVILQRGVATDADFEIVTGDGDDLIGVGNFGGYRSGLVIETGDDQDQVHLVSGIMREGLRGANSLRVVGFEMDWIEVDLGRGDDVLVNHMMTYFGDYLFNGGRGTDAHFKLAPPSPFEPVVSLAVAPWAFLNFEHTIMMPSLQQSFDPFMPDMTPFRP